MVCHNVQVLYTELEDTTLGNINVFILIMQYRPVSGFAHVIINLASNGVVVSTDGE
jgi:hypothetical protein